MRTAAVTALILCLTGALQAMEPGVEVLGLTGREPTIPEYAVTSGERVKVDLAVEAPLGSKVDILADFHQVTHGLSAPRGRGVLLARAVDFKEVTRRVVPVEIETPEVSGPAILLVQLHAMPSAQPSPVRFILKLYPRGEKGAFARAIAASEEKSGLKLALFGESPALRRYFKEQQITYRDLGTQMPNAFPKGCLIVGEENRVTPSREEIGSARLLFFRSRPEQRLPGIYRVETPSGTFTEVTFPLLPGLADDPRQQSILLDFLCGELSPL